MSHKESSVITTMVEVTGSSSDIKLEGEGEDYTLMDIKQEEISIKDENETEVEFNSFQNLLERSEDETFMALKQEEVHIKDEIPYSTTSIFQSNGNQDVDDNAHSVSFQQNQQFVSSHKTHREKLFVCNVCDYKSARKHHLKNHMRIHTGEKPFCCALCDFRSAQQCNFKVHMRCHTGEKPFACGLCDYKCALKCNLAVHMRSHTGEKPFVCSLCSFKASQKISLIIHMRNHAGEKPFYCELCDFNSAYKSSLVRHMKSHLNM